MNALINHLIENNLPAIASRSFLNCHCQGLHSIMLLESPGQTIRLFIAHPGHELYKNSPQFYQQGMSLGFHPHHCDLTLHCVYGHFWSWTIAEADPEIAPDFCQNSNNLPRATAPPFPENYVREKKTFPLRQYRYRSQITEGKQGFELIDAHHLMLSQGITKVDTGNYIGLSAEMLHTVYCDPFQLAAWLVYEGREDPQYNPFTFSTTELETYQPQNLYKPMSEGMVRSLLRMVKLL